jgi:hypothetical protein
MTNPPPTKSLPTSTRRPIAAPQPVDTTAVGEPEGAARKGVLSVPCPKPRPDTDPLPDRDDPTPERPGIRIYAPPVYRHPEDGARWSKRLAAIPTAAYACACGKTDTARGLRAVTALVDNYTFHRTRCPLRPHQEGRAAA